MTTERTEDSPGNGTSAQGGDNVERVGETGLILRMEFPHSQVREDFLIAFRGWLKQYKQTAETAYLVQAMIAEKVAAASGEDTSGFYIRPQFIGNTGTPPPASAGYAAAAWLAGAIWANRITHYSDWLPIF
jgi:hypothetical protein